MLGGVDAQQLVADRAQVWNSDHITRWNPTRVLAQCEAHTAILDLHRQIIDRGHDSAWPAPGHCAECWVQEVEDYQSFPCNTLRFLALAYQHRPGYREEWRP